MGCLDIDDSLIDSVDRKIIPPLRMPQRPFRASYVGNRIDKSSVSTGKYGVCKSVCPWKLKKNIPLGI